MKRLYAAILMSVCLALPCFAGDNGKNGNGTSVPADAKELKITVATAEAEAPPVTIVLGPRQSKVTPFHKGCAHTGGGNVIVEQTSPNTITVTMTGAAVATCAPFPSYATMDFDLSQCFEVIFADPEATKYAKVTMEGHVIGLLRGHHKCPGTAEAGNAVGAVSGCTGSLLSLQLPEHNVAGQSLAVNDREGPICAPICPGKYTLHQTFHLGAHCPLGLLPCKSVSAEFADGALDPLWLAHCEPFFGAAKGGFGFQIVITVDAVEEPVPAAAPATEVVPNGVPQVIPSPLPTNGTTVPSPLPSPLPK